MLDSWLEGKAAGVSQSLEASHNLKLEKENLRIGSLPETLFNCRDIVWRNSLSHKHVLKFKLTAWPWFKRFNIPVENNVLRKHEYQQCHRIELWKYKQLTLPNQLSQRQFNILLFTADLMEVNVELLLKVKAVIYYTSQRE